MKGPDPLDRAREALADAREARQLLEYSGDYEEPTGRTEVTVNLRHPSQPEITRPDNDKPAHPEHRLIGVLNVALGFKQWPQVVALAVLVAGLLVYLLRK